MNQVNDDGLQITESCSGFHTETQLLLKVPPKWNLIKKKDQNIF